MGRPAMLTVDDDPAVSRAVARDLRRRYGEQYQILRASSGTEALDALRELKLRGGRVAVMLADYRMPQMNGVEFLEQAMDLFPQARRCLLTAYADTDAAIQAINVVDVDHYLLKPWDPPEEKFYPVVDALLEAWKAAPDREVEEVKVVGHRWSAPSYRIRDFLARNLVPYRWFGADEPEGRRLLDAAGGGPGAIPPGITTGRRAEPPPNAAQGGGAAARVVRFDDGTELSAHAVILATGVAYRPLAAPGVKDLTGRGVYYGSAATEGPACAGTDVYIVGGANSAGQAALFFASHARTVTLVVRGDSLERSMSYYLIQQLAAIGNIQVRTRCQVVQAYGEEHLEAVTLCDSKEGTTSTVEAGHLFVFIGAEPRTDWLDGAVHRDPHGFVYTRPGPVTHGPRPAGWGAG